jgi:hypothetical protein
MILHFAFLQLNLIIHKHNLPADNFLVSLVIYFSLKNRLLKKEVLVIGGKKVLNKSKQEKALQFTSFTSWFWKKIRDRICGRRQFNKDYTPVFFLINKDYTPVIFFN